MWEARILRPLPPNGGTAGQKHVLRHHSTQRTSRCLARSRTAAPDDQRTDGGVRAEQERALWMMSRGVARSKRSRIDDLYTEATARRCELLRAYDIQRAPSTLPCAYVTVRNARSVAWRMMVCASGRRRAQRQRRWRRGDAVVCKTCFCEERCSARTYSYLCSCVERPLCSWPRRSPVAPCPR